MTRGEAPRRKHNAERTRADIIEIATREFADRGYAGARVDELEPAAALRQLAELTFDHHEADPDFVRLVSIENIHHAEHLRRSQSREVLSAPALDILARIMERGKTAGQFREDLDALDVHMTISAFCVSEETSGYPEDAGQIVVDPVQLPAPGRPRPLRRLGRIRHR